jgi:hypothetical protein
MTPLLTAPTPTASSADPGRPRRPLALSAAVAGAGAAGSVLMTCFALALAGWFAADGGAHGDTRDALRVGADAWLLAHGTALSLDTVTVGALPLGLTLICAWVAFRYGRWAGATSAVPDLRTLGLGVVVLAGCYAVVATMTAVLASVEAAEPHLAEAFLGGLVLSAVAGGAGALVGSGQSVALARSIPEWARCVLTGAASVVLLVLAAAAALVAGALAADLGTAATVLTRVAPDTSSALFLSVVVCGFVPNAVLLAVAYLLGPGFAVGSGTLVSPAVVSVGPVPAFPLLAALPSEGATPWWTTWLVAGPVLLAAVGAGLAGRRFRVLRFEVGAVRGLGAGLLAGPVLTALVSLAGGPAGPGRMAVVGASALEVLPAATVATAVGGLIGGTATVWFSRRAARRAERLSTAEGARG